MQKFLTWIEEKFMPPMARLAEQRYLKAIRDGIISALSLIIVGCFFIIVAQPPIDSLKTLVAPHVANIMIPYRITMGLMSIYAVYGMGYSLAKSYKLDGMSGGVLSLAGFLMMTIPLNIDGVINNAIKAGVDGADKITAPGWILPMGNLGAAGMFTGIIMMIFAVETLRILKKHKITIKMPDQVPESVARSFEALIPAAVVIIASWVVRVVLRFDLNQAIINIFKPINNIVGNSLIGVVLPVILITLLWSAGVHGVSIIGSILRPMWLIMLEQNALDLSNGIASNKLSYVAPEQFYQWFAWIGGSGATLSLCLLLIFSKSTYLRSVGRFSLIPGLFNINEPLIFGVPLVLNPILAIPFILAPTVMTILSYIAVKSGIISGFVVNAPWTLPAPIGAYLATGGDWKAPVLVIINILIGVAIYYPFFKSYESKLIKEENAQVSGAVQV